MPFLDTGTADERGFATPQLLRMNGGSSREEWDAIFNKLIDWAKAPGDVDEDGLKFPSVNAISRTIDVVGLCQQWRKSAPTAMVPDGEGGIALDWSRGEELESIRIEDDGFAECLRFEGQRLVDRFPLPTLAD
jgi:hypothetical protein